jgi:hypothetical protein
MCDIQDIYKLYDDFILVEDCLPVIVKKIGRPTYDFDFRSYFNCKSITEKIDIPVVLRTGALGDFDGIRILLENNEFSIIHSREQYNRASVIDHWYPLLKDITPKTVVYDSLPDVALVKKDFEFPVFIKGERQTAKHKKDLSIITNELEYDNLMKEWSRNRMLWWQRMAVREFVPLVQVSSEYSDMIPASLEFRVFFWKKQLAAFGRYWYFVKDYSMTKEDESNALSLAQQAANRIDVTFLVVDIAKTQEGKWIVIEVNDAQESGCAGVNQILLWNRILEIERLKGYETI